MIETTEIIHGAVGPVESVSAAVTEDTSLVETFEDTLKISQDVKLAECAASEEMGITEKEDSWQDRQTVCPSAAETSTSEPKWVVGAQCQVVWSEDGQMYPATVVSLDRDRCRVCFNGYGNEEDVELSVLQRPKAAPPTQRQSSQEWRRGSRCRAVYSEDGLVYPAVVLWVKGQRCRIRFDHYNNEEEQDVSSLLSPDELHGRGRAATKQGSSWKSSSTSNHFDWRRGENQGERGGERRSAWRDNQQNLSWVKERPSHQSKEEGEAAERRRGHQQRNEAEKLTNNSFPLFPPFPPPCQSSSGDPLSFIPPPPPPPPWMFGGRESGGSPGVDTSFSTLMLWYMWGFHTGNYMAQQLFRSSFRD